MISIGGTDFEPFLRVLLSGNFAQVEKVVVITDRDRDTTGVDQGQRRKQQYYTQFDRRVESGVLSVFVGESTLESDLIYEEANRDLLRHIYQRLHSRSEKKWRDVMEAVEQTASVEEQRQLIKHRLVDNLEKGEFAHMVSELLEAPDVPGQLQLPDYLEKAIRAVVV